MGSYLYSKWDGSGDFDLDKEELMDELSSNLMEDGDLSYALWKMRNWGLNNMRGRKPFSGLQELIQRLQKHRQNQLDKYKSIQSWMGYEKLDDILKRKVGYPETN
jgi:hypothetical protein